ncbi:MAG: hypothetical protein LUF78_01635 [Clostridiales bacterium]|nr:hypothetical protein [Clostridiales bacterium]
MNSADEKIGINVEYEKKTEKEKGLNRMEAYFNALNEKGANHHAEN